MAALRGSATTITGSAGTLAGAGGEGCVGACNRLGRLAKWISSTSRSLIKSSEAVQPLLLSARDTMNQPSNAVLVITLCSIAGVVCVVVVFLVVVQFKLRHKHQQSLTEQGIESNASNNNRKSMSPPFVYDVDDSLPATRKNTSESSHKSSPNDDTRPNTLLSPRLSNALRIAASQSIPRFFYKDDFFDDEVSTRNPSSNNLNLSGSGVGGGGGGVGGIIIERPGDIKRRDTKRSSSTVISVDVVNVMDLSAGHDDHGFPLNAKEAVELRRLQEVVRLQSARAEEDDGYEEESVRSQV
ncbi:hypothetical protein HDU79_005362 [Rhizoclosmatium sp. JEL0117]|nr:hypothetical protein HDU79_005362 [Rhizoclosmatium sp. JEL0117]